MTQVQAPAAVAAPAASSELTIKWLGDNSSAKDFQPTRNPNSVHYNDLKGISITVSQTSSIIDQAIRVKVSGFAGTQSVFNVATNAQNFMQAMQCWGPDPKAADFYKTCQWGGRYSGSGAGTTVYPDNILRVSETDNSPGATTYDAPFLTVSNKEVPGKNILDSKGAVRYPILDFFGPSTTNEVSSARIGSDGTGFFDFETQTSDQAPQLGCGTAAHLKCWLVVVPRGTHFSGQPTAPGTGSDPEGCSAFRTRRGDLYTYGQAGAVQVGSPVNPKCDYFDNRLVVPLDFTPTGVTCPKGNAEFRVSGSQLMVGAMSSWQPSLCQTVKSTFSFATNTDGIARAQLLETGAGSPQIIYSGYPVNTNELQSEFERTKFDKTSFAYAPVAVSSIVIAYIAEFANGRQESLVITPRMMAKILTQSYTFMVPASTSDPSKNIANLSQAARSYNFWNKDPEFQQANPTNWEKFSQYSPAVVLPGPSGADGIKQVWRWILADKDAAAFLDGQPDQWGMTVNPYFLPKGDPKAVVPWYLDDSKNYVETPIQRPVGLSKLDGQPLKLSSVVLDTFPKNDEGVVPLQKTVERTRFDSLQFAPYAIDFLSGARQTFRGDPNSRTIWDSTRINAAGEQGDWVSSGIQAPGSKFILTVTDSASAARYGLTAASVTGANSKAPVQSTPQTMGSALGALSGTTLDSVQQVDPAKVPSDGYPMTLVTYAGVNLSKSNAASRSTIATMLRQITSTGQVQGTAIGELPNGYLPLTSTLKDKAAAAAAAIEAFVAPVTTPAGPSTVPRPAAPAGAYSAEDGVVSLDQAAAADTAAKPETKTGVDAVSDERTAATGGGPLPNNGLLISLIFGVIGLLTAPFVLRGRGHL